MVFLKASDLSAIAFLSFVATVDAFWRMPLPSRTGLARLDPIVYPGAVADHAHAIHGGGAFGQNVTATELKDSSCTSAEVTQDKSAYWTPSLHFEYPNGTTVIVSQVGGMLAYYLLYSNDYDTSLGNITAFPDGFVMLAGDKSLRNFTGPIPDPPTSEWTAAESTQFALSQKALGFNCLNYDAAAEPTLYRHFMPNKTYLDNNCLDGLRLELMFPSCWNGVDLDSADHKSHMAYPSFVMTGLCPAGYDVKVPSLLYETIWDTYAFNGVDGQFVLSQGDPTGFGYHGDFMMGWESTEFLQEAVDTCTNLSGEIEDCALFDIQSQDDAALCTFEVPVDVEYDNVAGPREGLAVDVPIQSGPEPATGYAVVTLGPSGVINVASADATTTDASVETTTAGDVGKTTASAAADVTPTASLSSLISDEWPVTTHTISATGKSTPAMVTGDSTTHQHSHPRYTNSSVSSTAATPFGPTITASSSASATDADDTVTTTITFYRDAAASASDMSTVTTSYLTSASEIIELIVLATPVTVTVNVSQNACGAATATATEYPATFSTLTVSQSRTFTASPMPTLHGPVYANTTVPTTTMDPAPAGTAVKDPASHHDPIGTAAPSSTTADGASASTHPWAAVVLSPNGMGRVSAHRGNATVLRRSKKGRRAEN